MYCKRGATWVCGAHILREDAKGSSVGPGEQLLEEIRAKLFEELPVPHPRRSSTGAILRHAVAPPRPLVSGDARAQLIYERLAERLLEPDDGDKAEAAGLSPLARHQWDHYLQLSRASIERRSGLKDARGIPRVTRTYGSDGMLLRLELSDWQGRLRASMLFDAAGEPDQVQLMSSSGSEVVYTRDVFGKAVEDAAASRLSRLLESARQSVLLYDSDPSAKQEQFARRLVEALCQAVFPRLEDLLRRELEEGRQLIPTSEDLLEAELEQLLQDLLAEVEPGTTS